jgi:hypothetical protein
VVAAEAELWFWLWGHDLIDQLEHVQMLAGNYPEEIKERVPYLRGQAQHKYKQRGFR